MYEGMLSLMQMAKTSGALGRHAKAGLPYISVLTHPTTAGVMASFASLGDLILAEPKCMIGFAGPRVIKETTHQDLPPGFQTAEFLQDHGLIDLIVHRKQLRTTLISLLKLSRTGRPVCFRFRALARRLNRKPIYLALSRMFNDVNTAYDVAIDWLFGTQHRGVKLGLDNVRHLLAALGDPQSKLRFIHVAGTNGKGSVCAMIDSICRTAGIKTGLFTSPHLVRFNERIQIGGLPIDDADIVRGHPTNPRTH